MSERNPRHPASDIGSMPVARMDLRLSDEEKAALEREAKRQGVTLSDVARQAFAFYLGYLEGQRQTQAPPSKG